MICFSFVAAFVFAAEGKMSFYVAIIVCSDGTDL